MAKLHVFNIVLSGIVGLKRTTKNVIATTPKIGCTTKHRLNAFNHMCIQNSLVRKHLK